MINPLLFETDTSGYTQFGRAYLSLQSDVPAQDFIDGYVQAAARSHRALRRIRALHLRTTAEVLRNLEHGHKRAIETVTPFDCR